MTSRIACVLLSCALVIAVCGHADAGAIFITGHDADNHGNGLYQRAGLDYLVFGQAATPAQAALRSSIKIGYLGTINGSTTGGSNTESGYTNRIFYDLDSPAWTNVFTDNVDVIMVGSGLDYNNAVGISKLNAEAASFTNYFNNGGSIFIHTDEGRGQSFYGFVPSFGMTTNNTISSAGAFSVTAAGLAIGLTESIVDADITHSYYTGVDANLFTVFETFNQNGSPVAFGLRNASIDDDGFNTVPEPSSLALMFMGAASLFGYGVRRKRKVTA